MRTYLSVDVDFWFEPTRARKQLVLLMQRVGKNIPIIAVMNHQQMLASVNASNAQRLINVDAHSDLTESSVRRLNCGTWVSYVTWRKLGEYIWIRPDAGFQNSCNGDDRAIWNAGTDWKYSVSRYISSKNLKLTTYLQGCVGLGLCMSPAYATTGVVEVFREIVDRYGIPYHKGRLSELNTKYARPSGFPRPPTKAAERKLILEEYGHRKSE
ncbi:hypothetical protein M0R72_00905 [Candidatus Pacearchaeota archaeon]|jgi:hypothetical protein|nr:hypothetical protein [Candidatus Pacearchaeota archaeon]